RFVVREQECPVESLAWLEAQRPPDVQVVGRGIRCRRKTGALPIARLVQQARRCQKLAIVGGPRRAVARLRDDHWRLEPNNRSPMKRRPDSGMSLVARLTPSLFNRRSY